MRVSVALKGALHRAAIECSASIAVLLFLSTLRSADAVRTPTAIAPSLIFHQHPTAAKLTFSEMPVASLNEASDVCPGEDCPRCEVEVPNAAVESSFAKCLKRGIRRLRRRFARLACSGQIGPGDELLDAVRHSRCAVNGGQREDLRFLRARHFAASGKQLRRKGIGGSRCGNRRSGCNP